MRRTKIVATIGPASNSPENILALIEAGVDYFRLNFSHGNLATHRVSIQRVRDAATSKGKPVGILADLQGPKIRVGEIKNGGIDLKKGDNLVITTRSVMGNQQEVSTTYSNLPMDVKPGDQFLLDDGLLTFQVLEIDKDAGDITCEVLYSGRLKSRKGINLPDVAISAPSLTEDDIENAIFAIEQDVDYIALSFVRSPKDIIELKALIHQRGKEIPVISKIERKEALEEIDNIIEVTDALMVARGDMGIEVGLEKVPLLQKEVIRKCNIKGKPVITATQMLESMIKHPKPTRAEVSDVANAILDGTDAIMLSGETAVGEYPIKAVQEMVAISEEIENKAKVLYNRRHGVKQIEPGEVEESLARSASDIAQTLNAKAILAWTNNGDTIRLLSKYHPTSPIFALTEKESIARRVQLCWGVRPFVLPPELAKERNLHDDKILKKILHHLNGFNTLCSNDLVLIVGMLSEYDPEEKAVLDRINSIEVETIH